MTDLPKLVASDIGGTLTSNGRPISSYTAEVFHKLLGRGIPIALITGYNYHSTRHYTQDLDSRILLIIQNGTTCLQGGKITWEKRVEEPIAREVVDLISSRQLPVYLYKGLAENFQIYYKNTAPKPASGSLPLSPGTSYKNVTEISTQLPTTILEETRRSLAKILHNRAQIIVSKGPKLSWLEVTPFSVRKDQAIQELCRILHLQVADVIYFGDNLNDIEALRLVGYPVIVENSLSTLKKEFIQVIGHVDEESVAHYLSRLFKL
jgi:Cof subfamily protein (haloacid dehalogenase superfamily)